MDHTSYYYQQEKKALKGLFVIILIAIMLPHSITAQPCLGLGVTFSTQAQIDSFQINYPGCTEIAGSVTITGNDITNLDSLNVLNSVWLDLIIYNNPFLSDIDGLNNLTSVGWDLAIDYCPNLHSLFGLDNLNDVGKTLGILYIDSIVDMTGLNNLEYVQSLVLEGNSNLKSLVGLDSLSIIGEGLYIADCDSLINLHGLEYLDSLGGLHIYDNESILSLSGLEFDSASIYYCQIMYNDNLTNLEGLENVISVPASCDIVGNPILESLIGLNNVTILGNLKIHDNPSLQSLVGLENVTLLEFLDIYNNLGLISLSGIDSVSASTITGISIKQNPSLSTCAVQSICDYLLLPGGNAEISNNAPGCNSQEEVEEACIVTIPEQRSEAVLSIYPNPFTSTTTIEYELTELSDVQLTIYNAIGKTIQIAVDGIKPQGKHTYYWTPESLSEGLYYAVLKSEEGVAVVKMMKQ